MDEISQLLKEAKPLYFKRKRNKEIARKCLYTLLPIVFGSFLFLPYSDIDNSMQISYIDNSSVVEQMGLPTDDYGLLKVD